MKYPVLSGIVLSLLLALPAAAQSFEEAYAKTDEAVKFGARMYNGAIRPVWTDAETFVYQTHEPGGDAWYRVSGTVKEAITKEDFEESRKGRGRGYYDRFFSSLFTIHPSLVTNFR
jgi:hypothetical protein